MLPVKLPQDIDLNIKGNPLDAQNNWKEIEINEKNLPEKLIHSILLSAHLVLSKILFSFQNRLWLQ